MISTQLYSRVLAKFTFPMIAPYSALRILDYVYFTERKLLLNSKKEKNWRAPSIKNKLSFFNVRALISVKLCAVKPCPNGKCLATKRDQTLFGYKTFSRLDTLFGVVGSCLIVFGCV